MQTEAKLTYRLYEPKDHEILVKWWEAWKWPPVPHKYLSQSGLIVSDEKEDLAAGFIYFTGSPIAWMEWLVGNPTANKEDRRKALNEVISLLENAARLSGAELLYTSAAHPGLKERLQNLGFMMTEESISMFMKEIH